MERENDYDNDGLDPSEEYFRKKKKSNDEKESPVLIKSNHNSSGFFCTIPNCCLAIFSILAGESKKNCSVNS